MEKSLNSFDLDFIEAVESIEDYFGWSYVLSTDLGNNSISQELNKKGFNNDDIKTFVSKITGLSTDTLIDICLSDDVAYDAACGALRLRTAAYDKDRALALIQSQVAKERQVGVQMLFYWLGKPHEDEVIPALYDLADREKNEEVQIALCFTLHQLMADQKESHLKHLANSTNERVRWAAASTFNGLEPAGVEALKLLSRDPDVQVREAAVTSLGISLYTRLDEIEELSSWKQVFVDRLSDENRNTRLEAISALGRFKEKDALGLKALVRELNDTYVSFLVVSAAQDFADPILCPLLENLLKSRDVDDPDCAEIQKALIACGRVLTDQPMYEE